ncbi:PaaR repeat-containing protein [Vibrio sp. V37_P2S8PM304]|uniref:PAAR domain-containing protein n=1 Tax=Vibrio sp. V37_P2S8PM304 TaxID=1938688 RepID=UPI001372E83A|nr:PAAR domain-containing protein [Vibrio sp. V37_P2S8PM304]NAX31981.1 PaaR repeat-containing protein [Vibrio sp. V37_P2S8PM304]
MSSVTRKGDRCSGHGSFPSRVSTGGSPNVFINGQAVHRVGDAWASHCDATPVCHGGSLAGGSGTVFANGQAVGRVGDAVDCGSSVASGSSDVFCG